MEPFREKIFNPFVEDSNEKFKGDKTKVVEILHGGMSKSEGKKIDLCGKKMDNFRRKIMVKSTGNPEGGQI